MVNNYAKVMGAFKREMFFPFDDKDPILTHRALESARRYSKVVHGNRHKPIVVWKPFSVMPNDVRCVGHAAEEKRSPEGRLIAWRCLNCDQVIDEQSNGIATGTNGPAQE